MKIACSNYNSLKNPIHHILPFISVLPFLFSYGACQTKKQKQTFNFSRNDTISIIQTALEDEKLDSIFKIAWHGQELKLVSNEFIKSDYDVIYHGKSIPIVSYDSAYYNPLNETTRFLGVVNLFKMISKNQAKIVLVFHGIGVLADFVASKSDGRWLITKRVFGRI